MQEKAWFTYRASGYSILYIVWNSTFKKNGELKQFRGEGRKEVEEERGKKENNRVTNGNP